VTAAVKLKCTSDSRMTRVITSHPCKRATQKHIAVWRQIPPTTEHSSIHHCNICLSNLVKVIGATVAVAHAKLDACHHPVRHDPVMDHASPVPGASSTRGACLMRQYGSLHPVAVACTHAYLSTPTQHVETRPKPCKEVLLVRACYL
jgi:hypothetical protein